MLGAGSLHLVKMNNFRTFPHMLGSGTYFFLNILSFFFLQNTILRCLFSIK